MLLVLLALYFVATIIIRWSRLAELRAVAYQSSLITHSHLLGMEGGALQAMAVALDVSKIMVYYSCKLPSGD